MARNKMAQTYMHGILQDDLSFIESTKAMTSGQIGIEQTDSKRLTLDRFKTAKEQKHIN